MNYFNIDVVCRAVYEFYNGKYHTALEHPEMDFPMCPVNCIIIKLAKFCQET